MQILLRSYCPSNRSGASSVGCCIVSTAYKAVHVMNQHFSRSFCLIFHNTYDPYLSRSYLINLANTCFKPFRLFTLFTDNKKTCVLIPKRSRHNVCTTTGDLFPNKTKHELYSIRVKPQARPSKTTLPPGSENQPGRSSRS